MNYRNTKIWTKKCNVIIVSYSLFSSGDSEVYKCISAYFCSIALLRIYDTCLHWRLTQILFNFIALSTATLFDVFKYQGKALKYPLGQTIEKPIPPQPHVLCRHLKKLDMAFKLTTMYLDVCEGG